MHHHHYRGVQQYLMKYVGYDQSQAMWLDEDELVNAADVLQAYKQQIALLNLVQGSYKGLTGEHEVLYRQSLHKNEA